MGLFGKSKREKERDRLFNAVKEAAAAADIGAASGALLSIRQHPDLHKDPEFPFLLDSAITGMMKKSTGDAMHLAMWALSYFDDTHARQSLTSKIFALTERVDRTDMKQLAGVAMAMLSVADSSPSGSDDFKRARKEWLAAVDELAAKKPGLDYAFAAASNAAIGMKDYMPLRKDAIQKWDDILINLAKTDKRGALREAFRMANGYDNFGTGAAEIRARAHSVVDRINKMKP